MANRLKITVLLGLLMTFMACSTKSEEELVAEGRSQMDAEAYEEAIATFDKVLAINPQNSTALNAKGVALIRTETVN